jgi:hypothetical protein
MQLAAHNYRENPTHPDIFQPSKKKVRDDQKDLDNKEAFINKEISLYDYLHSQAANIDYIEYLDSDNQADEVLNPLNELSLEQIENYNENEGGIIAAMKAV